MTDINFQNDLNFRPSASRRATYTYNIIHPTSTNPVTISPGQMPEVSFELPITPLNLAKSTISFDMGITGEDGRSVWLSSAVPFASVSFMSRSGTKLVDLNYANVYQQTMQDICKPKDRYASTALYNAGRYLSAPYHPGNTVRSGKNTILVDSILLNNESSTMSLEKTTRFFPAVLEQALDAPVKWSIPLSDFYETFLAMDKLISFPTVMILRLNFLPLNQLGFTSAAAINEFGIDDPTFMANQQVIANNIPITNIQLNLACSTDLEANASAMEMSRKPFSLTIPYPYIREDTTNQPLASISTRLNVGFGMRLLDLVFVSYPLGAENLRIMKTANINDNAGGYHIEHQYSTLDSVRLQNHFLTSEDGADFRQNQRIIDGSNIDSASQYRLAKVHIDSFRAGRSIDWPEMSSLQYQDGLQLESAERTYSVVTKHTQLPGPVGYNRISYLIAHTQRQVSFNENLVSII